MHLWNSNTIALQFLPFATTEFCQCTIEQGRISNVDSLCGGIVWADTVDYNIGKLGERR